MVRNARATKPCAQRLPRHIAIMMDGNGRWARGRKLPRHAGHRAGVNAARNVVEACADRRIEALTLFAFSSENWLRPKSEVSLLMGLFLDALNSEFHRLHDNDIRIRFIGALETFPPQLCERMLESQRLTKDNPGMRLIIAVGYGGRWDLVQATRRLATEVSAGRLRPEAIEEQHLTSALSLADVPDPDLFIRTGGERRISNFLLWNMAYTELYFSDVLWPDFTTAALGQALRDYAYRERRFGRLPKAADSRESLESSTVRGV